MEFKDQELETSFSVPEKPTVRQVLRYDSLVELGGIGEYGYERMWRGVEVFAEDWESPHVKPDDDLDNVESSEAIDVIKWAGLAVWSYRQSLKDLPKNS